MSQTVIGIFDNESEARKAVEQLVDNGFSRSDIDISDRSANVTDSTATRRNEDDDSIGGFFRSLFGSDDDTRKYSTVASRSCVVTVHAHSASEAESAADILDEYGSVDVNDRYSQYSNLSGTTAGAVTGSTFNSDVSDIDTVRDRDRLNLNTTDLTSTDDTQSLKVIEEQMQVGKRTIETGGVRLKSRIVEKPVEESLRLREEHVRVERHPVDRAASQEDLANFQQGTIEMTEHAEVPVVNKEARVVEEISLNKDVEEREETIRETLRRTDVEVENLGTDATTRRYDADERRLDADERRLDDDDELSRPRGL
jgi:uncharacterized protein (TIGR02271 family)